MPRLPLALLRALLSHAERDEVMVEVADEYAERVASEGRAAARRWLWRQALGSVAPLIGWSWCVDGMGSSHGRARTDEEDRCR